MTRLHHFAESYPRLVAMVVLAFFALMFTLPVLIYGPIDLSDGRGLIDLDLLLDNLPVQALTCVVVLGIVAALGWWRATGLTNRPNRRGMRLAIFVGAIPLTFFVLIGVALLAEQPGQGHLTALAVILLFNMAVGLFEETLFRGIVFHGLRAQHGLWFSVLASSLLFGVFHLVNLAIGQDWSITLFQVTNATALGIFFCAIYLQANSLWPAIVLHALWNSYAMAGQRAASDLPFDDLAATDIAVRPASFILPLLITLSGVWIIRRWQRQTPPPIPPAAFGTGQ